MICVLLLPDTVYYSHDNTNIQNGTVTVEVRIQHGRLYQNTENVKNTYGIFPYYFMYVCSLLTMQSQQNNFWLLICPKRFTSLQSILDSVDLPIENNLHLLGFTLIRLWL